MAGLHAVHSGDEDLLDDWVLWMQARGMAKRTIHERPMMVERVAKASNVAAHVLSSRQILTYLGRSGVGQSTRANYHVALAAWFKWLVEQELREDNPMTRIPRPKIPRRRPRPIETAHLEKLLASRMHRRTRTMILLAAFAGLRVHEIAKIRGEDIDQLGKRLYVVGKGGVDEWLPLHPRIAEEAMGYPRRGYWFTTYTGNHDHEAGPVLPASVSSIVSIAMARAGIPGTAHALRHWYGTQLVRAGADLRTAQTLLRHASLATTQIYVAVGEDRRSEAINRLPGFGDDDPDGGA
jgi:integrase/recombinase XerD